MWASANIRCHNMPVLFFAACPVISRLPLLELVESTPHGEYSTMVATGAGLQDDRRCVFICLQLICHST